MEHKFNLYYRHTASGDADKCMYEITNRFPCHYALNKFKRTLGCANLTGITLLQLVKSFALIIWDTRKVIRMVKHLAAHTLRLENFISSACVYGCVVNDVSITAAP